MDVGIAGFAGMGAKVAGIAGFAGMGAKVAWIAGQDPCVVGEYGAERG